MPITLAWWYFITRVSVDYLMQIYLEAVPLHVQTILGQRNFHLNDLLRLRGNWKDCSWGVYLNILTKPGQDWYRLYVGSATATGDKSGFWRRIGTYYNWIKIRMDPAKQRVLEEGGAHGRAVLNPEVQIQFVKLAIFSANTSRTYVLFFEALMMIFFQVFKSRNVSRHAPIICYDWAEQCQPKDILDIDPSIGLNNAWTLKQGIGSRAPKGGLCSHCHGKSETKSGKSAGWHHRDPSRPYEDMICASCGDSRRRCNQLPPLVEVDGVLKKRTQHYKPEMYVHHCVSCGTREVGTKPDSATDGKSRCALCRSNFAKALKNNKAGNSRKYKDSPIAHYSRNEFPSEAPMTDAATDPEPLCAHCGKVVGRGINPTEVDGKIRHLSCKGRLQDDLKTLEKGSGKNAHLPRFKDRETLIAHYSNSGRNERISGANHYCFRADEHVHPCVACANKRRQPTRPHGPDGKHRCTTCRSTFDQDLKSFEKGRSKRPDIESLLADFCKYEVSSLSS